MASPVEQAGRRVLSRLIVALSSFLTRSGRLRAVEEDPWRFLERDPERVLLVRHDDRIGNLVLMTPLLQAVRARWPSAAITVLIGPRFAALYDGLPWVDHIWLLEKQRILRNPLRYFRLVRGLRRASFDVAVDCSHMHSFSLTGGLLVRASGAPVRIAYDRGEASAFANLLVEPLQAEHHESIILCNLLRPFLDEVGTWPLALRLTEEERIGARAALEEAGIGEAEMVVGIHVGGRGAKRWSTACWMALLERIQQLYRVRLFILCGPDEEEEADRIAASLGEGVPLFSSPPLRRMVALIGACTFFLAPDTGPMHVAAALGVPTVAVFLQPNAVRYGPLGPLHRVVEAAPTDGADRVLEVFAEVVRQRFGSADPAGEV